MSKIKRINALKAEIAKFIELEPADNHVIEQLDVAITATQRLGKLIVSERYQHILESEKGGPFANPVSGEWRAMQKQSIKIMQELGLTPAARAKILGKRAGSKKLSTTFSSTATTKKGWSKRPKFGVVEGN